MLACGVPSGAYRESKEDMLARGTGSTSLAGTGLLEHMETHASSNVYTDFEGVCKVHGAASAQEFCSKCNA